MIHRWIYTITGVVRLDKLDVGVSGGGNRISVCHLIALQHLIDVLPLMQLYTGVLLLNRNSEAVVQGSEIFHLESLRQIGFDQRKLFVGVTHDYEIIHVDSDDCLHVVAVSHIHTHRLTFE